MAASKKSKASEESKPSVVPAPAAAASASPPAQPVQQDPNMDPVKGARVGAPAVADDRKPLEDVNLAAAIDSLKAVVENHSKWIDYPPAEGEDGFVGFDRTRLIQERSMAQSALNMLGIDMSQRLR